MYNAVRSKASRWILRMHSAVRIFKILLQSCHKSYHTTTISDFLINRVRRTFIEKEIYGACVTLKANYTCTSRRPAKYDFSCETTCKKVVCQTIIERNKRFYVNVCVTDMLMRSESCRVEKKPVVRHCQQRFDWLKNYVSIS